VTFTRVIVGAKEGDSYHSARSMAKHKKCAVSGHKSCTSYIVSTAATYSSHGGSHGYQCIKTCVSVCLSVTEVESLEGRTTVVTCDLRTFMLCTVCVITSGPTQRKAAEGDTIGKQHFH